MASRILSPGARVLSAASRFAAPARNFQTSAQRLSDAIAAPVLPARKPVGAFRGGLFGFLAGSSLTGAAVYSYAIQEYKAANELLMEDIYTLQAATHRMSNYLTTLEEKIDTVERKSK